MSARDRTTTQVSTGGASAGPARWLLLVGDGHLAMHPLPEVGELVLGRDDGCDIRLEHAKISRRHARLLIGASVEVEDLGSTNGIRLGDRTLERGVLSVFARGGSLHLGPYPAAPVEGL